VKEAWNKEPTNPTVTCPKTRETLKVFKYHLGFLSKDNVWTVSKGVSIAC